MAFIFENGVRQDVTAQISANDYKEAQDKNLTVSQLYNQRFPKADIAYGTAAEQIYASEGLVLVGKNKFGLRPLTTAEVLDGKGYNAAGNVKDNGDPFGTASRILFPSALLDMVESAVPTDYTTDSAMFNGMVAQELSIASEQFEQPVIDYGTKNGPEQAKAQRISQFSEPPVMMRFGTSNRIRTLPTYGMLVEFSQQALRATTLDMVAMTVNRYMQIEKDERVYSYIADLFAGNLDMVTGAVPAVTSSTYNGAATGGVLTHKAWMLFLANNRKKRKITHCIGSIATYMKVEGRTGRPGSNNYDPTLSRVNAEAVAMNAGFGNDVKWFITDTAANGGPVPDNTVYALDATKAITRVTNTAASYSASESFALRRSEAMVFHWSSEVFRFFGDTDTSPFDILTID